MDSSSSNSTTASTTTTTTTTTTPTSQPPAPKKIQKLTLDVINRISAGEVIQRPSNALKELIENSLDAQSTTVTVTVKEGGMKLLQIQDNGSGIKKEDLEIVCERFTTSKLQKFEDLRKIQTFGFRGEALSSISHVSHLKILTKTADSNCAYRAFYADGKLAPANPNDSPDPKPCAGVNGTQITAEDLFFNVPARKKVLKNTQEEHTRIVDLMKKYAINNSKVSFVLKKFGETTPDVHTPGDLSEKEAITMLYGSDVGKELRELSSSNEKLEFHMKGLFTTTNYNAKKSVFILFINSRLVDCKNLKSGLEQLYAKYLPKGTHPFMFVRLTINPRNVDVNIHPTKSEVRFLYEEQIIEIIQKVVDTELNQSINSKTFQPAAQNNPTDSFQDITVDSPPLLNDHTKSKKSQNPTTDEKQFGKDIGGPPNLYPSQVVRSLDSKTQSISAFIKPLNGGRNDDDDYSGEINHHKTTSNNNDIILSKKRKESDLDQDGGSSGPIDMDDDSKNVSDDENDEKGKRDTTSSKKQSLDEFKMANSPSNGGTTFINTRRTKKFKQTELISIKELVAAINTNKHQSGLQEFFTDCTFVGCLDHSFALAQHQTKLYIINIESISKEMMYQNVLHGFHNFDSIQFTNPLSVKELLSTALDSPLCSWVITPNTPKEALIEEFSSLLINYASMLNEYFSISFVDGNICSLPQLIDNYVPCLDNLPMFLFRLVTEVDWRFEKQCFDMVAKELALFYKIESSSKEVQRQLHLQQQNNNNNNDNNNNNNNHNNHNNHNNNSNINGKEWVIQHLIFPAFRRFVPPKQFSSDGSIIQITTVENLYKVFERC